mmetsp:Transcript_40263/g.54778  ORF Transcript_40263/g.54778 Transcript_40263/m.54778 type:complete len:122 (-) Transcript_40263:107-472(-)
MMRIWLLVLGIIFVARTSCAGSLRHAVLGIWTEDATDQAKDQALSCLSALPSSVPEIYAYSVGSDIGETSGNYDFGLVGEFLSIDDFEAYENSAAHQACLSLLSSILASSAKVEFPFNITE